MYDDTVYIGRNFNDVLNEFREQGKSIRISSVNGVPGVLTADFRSDRLNVHVDGDNKIIGINGYG